MCTPCASAICPAGTEAAVQPSTTFGGRGTWQHITCRTRVRNPFSSQTIVGTFQLPGRTYVSDTDSMSTAPSLQLPQGAGMQRTEPLLIVHMLPEPCVWICIGDTCTRAAVRSRVSRTVDYSASCLRCLRDLWNSMRFSEELFWLPYLLIRAFMS
jgi:hypothetical protein